MYDNNDDSDNQDQEYNPSSSKKARVITADHYINLRKLDEIGLNKRIQLNQPTTIGRTSLVRARKEQ